MVSQQHKREQDKSHQIKKKHRAKDKQHHEGHTITKTIIKAITYVQEIMLSVQPILD